MSTARALMALLVVLSALTACDDASVDGGYQLVDFAIDGPTQLTSGAQTVDVANIGEFPHTLVVTDSTGEVVAATDVVQPGEAVNLSLELEPGRYSFTCRIVAQTSEGQIVDHFEAGMNTTVDVTG